MQKRLTLLVLCLMLLVSIPVHAQQNQTLAQVIANTPDISIFASMLDAADPALLERLENPNARTVVFAPTNNVLQAFLDELDEDTLSDILADTELLTSILSYHMLLGSASISFLYQFTEATNMANFMGRLLTEPRYTLRTVNGQTLTLTIDDGALIVDGAGLVAMDINTRNGVLNIIDAVLMPEMRPIPEVIATLPTDMNLSRLSTAVITDALETLGLVDLLSDPDAEYTLFLPEDQAIYSFGLQNFQTILEDVDAGVDLLSYHVVAGRIDSTMLVEMLLEDEKQDDIPEWYAGKDGNAVLLNTLQGGIIRIDPIGMIWDMSVNNARIVLFDVNASNGVIHVISGVIMP